MEGRLKVLGLWILRLILARRARDFWNFSVSMLREPLVLCWGTCFTAFFGGMGACFLVVVWKVGGGSLESFGALDFKAHFGAPRA